MKKKYILLTILCIASVVLFGQNKTKVIGRAGENIIQGELIVKVKEEFRTKFIQNELSETTIFPLFAKFNISNISKKFPRIDRPRVETNKYGYKLVDLSCIYKINYTEDFNEYLAAKMFYGTGLFEYVEVQVIPDLLYIPNDPKISTQYHLSLINAFDAWEIQRGDSNVVIGITDTGIDTDHPDLSGRIKMNYNDPVDGIDNDFDGYVDNFIGWDFGDNDNDPEVYKHHGIQVTGMAVAKTNNNENIAAIGHQVKVLPVKISNSDGYLVGAYDGIIYAADHGADIINCSWGGSGGFSLYNQDIINYATINKRALVVAAAGNNNATSYFYPASYDNVVSVGGTDELDQKWDQSGSFGSQYNDKIDVVAPSYKVVSLLKGGGSGQIGSGTSFAAPIVSRLAGLIKSQYPDASPQKISAIIKSSTDDIYSISGNEQYTGMLGTGRVNAYKALLPITTPFIAYFNHQTDDGYDQNLSQGDTVLLKLELINQLESASNISVLIRSNDGMSEVLDSISYITTLGTDEVKGTETDFKFVVSATAGINSSASFEVEITDGSNVWFDHISVKVNRDYIDITTNNLNLSFNNYGRIGYTYNGEGLGVDYKGGGSLIKEMGVLLGITESNVLSYEDYELITFEPAKVVSANADFCAKGILDDQFSANPIGVTIDQIAYAWKAAPNEDYVIYEYIIKNPTSSPMNDIYLGIYGDWDIGDADSNTAAFDVSKDLGYVYEKGGLYAGIKALRSKKVNYYAFDKSGNEGINLEDGFDDAEEFQSMSSGLSHTTAFGDVAHIISNGPYLVPAGDSIVVAFAILAGLDLADIKAHAQSAEVMYESLRGINVSVNNIKNISCYGSDDGEIDLGVDLFFEPYTVDWFHDSSETSVAISGLSEGDYNVAITDKNGISKLVNFSINEPEKLKVDIISTIDAECHGVKNGTVNLMVEGGSGSYSYNWGNPIIPSIENPQLSAGDYELIVNDIAGCLDTIEVQIEEPVALTAHTVFLLNDTAITCDGEASILASGGVAPYLYSWNNSALISNEYLDGLCGGDYTVIIIDANDCEFEHHVMIETPSEYQDSIASSVRYEIISNLKLYPNPANDYLIAEFKSLVEEEITIKVIDIKGKLIQNVYADQVYSENYNVILNTTNYKAGNYFIMMSSNKGASIFPFEVQH